MARLIPINQVMNGGFGTHLNGVLIPSSCSATEVQLTAELWEFEYSPAALEVHKRALEVQDDRQIDVAELLWLKQYSADVELSKTRKQMLQTS